MTTTTPEQGWEALSACREAEPGLFFPLRADAVLQVRRAKTFCAACAVRDRCLAEALRSSHSGIWGGTTTEERRTMGTRGRRAS